MTEARKVDNKSREGSRPRRDGYKTDAMKGESKKTRGD